MTNRRTLLTGLAAAAIHTSFPAMAGPSPDYLKSLPPEERAELEARQARLLAALPYEQIKVPGAQALIEWERLLTAGRGYPIIIGGDDELERLAEQFSQNDPAFRHPKALPTPAPPSPQDIIKLADSLEWPRAYQKWLKDSGNNMTLQFTPPGGSGMFSLDEVLKNGHMIEDHEAPVGDWPDQPSPSPGLTVTYDYGTRGIYEQVYILLIPTDKPWEIPAYLRWGNWNACPPDEYHVAALKSWHERYGAELVAISGDVMNLRVARPPATRDAALALAREHYSYCADIVDQGVGTLSALAASLLDEPCWYFWWD